MELKEWAVCRESEGYTMTIYIYILYRSIKCIVAVAVPSISGTKIFGHLGALLAARPASLFCVIKLPNPARKLKPPIPQSDLKQSITRLTVRCLHGRSLTGSTWYIHSVYSDSVHSVHLVCWAHSKNQALPVIDRSMESV